MNHHALLAGTVATALAVMVTTPASAVTIACNDTIDTTGQTVVVDNDLNCASGLLQIIGSGEFDFNGHTFTCTAGGVYGPHISGTGVEVRNGTIDGCQVGLTLAAAKIELSNMQVLNSVSHGVDIQATCVSCKFVGNRVMSSGERGFNGGAEKLKFEGNVSSGNTYDGFNLGAGSLRAKFKNNLATDNGGAGFNVWADRASMKGDIAIGNNYGFEIDGEGVKLSGLTALDSDHTNFVVYGNGCKVAKCRAMGARRDGYDIEGTKCSVLGNTALFNEDNGFTIGQDRIKVKKNVAFGNGEGTEWDIEDVPGCTGDNQYSGNSFGTSLGGACIK